MKKTSTNELVGRKIKELRVKESLTQKQLADELSISDKHLSKIENGHKSASTAMIDKLCEIFKITPPYFFSPLNLSNEQNTKEIILSIIEDLKVAELTDLKIIQKVVKDIIFK